MPITRARLARAERMAGAAATRPDPRLAAYRADPARLMADAGLAPDPWQQDLLRSDADRVLMLTCRQAGKSTTAGFLALREALLHPGRTVLQVSRSQRQSTELFRRTVEAFNRLGRPGGAAAESATRLELGNGSRVLSLPGSEANIRCYTIHMAILDEAARIADPLYFDVRPMLATTGGKLVCLSTAFAKSGFFYDAWTGPDAWTRVKVTADMNPRVSRAFLDEERRVLGPRWFGMEHLCEFGDDAAAVFRADDIRAALADDTLAPLFGRRS
ncbi:MAG: terminase family protein [Gemmataceae bacterium]